MHLVNLSRTPAALRPPYYTRLASPALRAAVDQALADAPACTPATTQPKQ